MINVSDRFDAIYDEQAPDERRREAVLSTAELAECVCPDFCERDHDTD